MTLDERDRRIGLNEAMFRRVNERLKELNETFSTFSDTIELVCECGDASCTERIEMTPDAYRRLREDPARFVVRPGHVAAAVEAVVERREGYEILRKYAGSAEELARATNG